MASHSHYQDLLAHAYTAEFATWEQQALAHKDVLRRPKELHSRARVAQTIREIRLGKTPDLDEATVLEELRKLVVDQTKAQNCCDVYRPEEIETIKEAARRRSDWSELLRWLKNVRKETQRRYDLLMAAQDEQQGYSDGWAHSSQDIAA